MEFFLSNVCNEIDWFVCASTGAITVSLETDDEDEEEEEAKKIGWLGGRMHEKIPEWAKWSHHRLKSVFAKRTQQIQCLRSARTAQSVCTRRQTPARIAHIYEYIFWFLLGGFSCAPTPTHILFPSVNGTSGAAATECNISIWISCFVLLPSTSRFNTGAMCERQNNAVENKNRCT